MQPERITVAFGDSRLPERFWAKVEVRPDGCWQWTGALTRGYAMFRSPDGESNRAYRYAYCALVADPGELTLDHLCRNRACVNPAHLEPVTNAENVLRGEGLTARRARQTHCKRGHSLEGENAYRRPTRPNHRICRICAAESQRELRARVALAALDGGPDE